MKKILVLALALLMFAMGTACAEKSKYEAEDYSFKNVKVVNLVGSNAPSTPASDSYFPAEAPVDKVINYVRADLGKYGKFLQTSGQQSTMNADNRINKVLKKKGSATVNLTINVYKMGYDKTWKAPWDETVTKQEKKVAKDEHGNDVIVEEPVQETVHHDGEWQHHCYADVEFLVKDTSGKLVYSVRDTRDRDGQDYDGMLGRICKDFAKDLRK
jgi:hypothetical protein